MRNAGSQGVGHTDVPPYQGFGARGGQLGPRITGSDAWSEVEGGKIRCWSKAEKGKAASIMQIIDLNEGLSESKRVTLDRDGTN